MTKRQTTERVRAARRRLAAAARVLRGQALIETAPARDGLPGPFAGGQTELYERLYETHARRLSPEEAIGDGDYDLVGRIELSVLIQEGLQPSGTLVDFGCGTGRLAVHAVKFLSTGCFVGTDISQTMLLHARRRVGSVAHSCRVEWVHQDGYSFDLPVHPADMICAFSVFTHMEHEDAYRYLLEARAVIRPGGSMVFSCLPMDLEASRAIFLDSASEDLVARWKKVRNVTTSRQLMDEIARLAGWRVVRWHPGDEPTIRLFGTEEKSALGQSVCVLKAPS